MNQKNIAFSYAKYNFISEKGIVKDRNIPFNEKVNYHDLLKTNHIGCLTAMYDITRIMSKNKIFMSEMRI